MSNSPQIDYFGVDIDGEKMMLIPMGTLLREAQEFIGNYPKQSNIQKPSNAGFLKEFIQQVYIKATHAAQSKQVIVFEVNTCKE